MMCVEVYVTVMLAWVRFPRSYARPFHLNRVLSRGMEGEKYSSKRVVYPIAE